MMRTRTLVGAVLAFALLSAGASDGTLHEVKQRGYLKCAVRAGHEGLASPDVYGEWKGLDADFCRAVAAAVLGDVDRVMFVSANRGVGIDSLALGSADLLARAPTGLGVDGVSGRQVGVLLQDSYGFLARGTVSGLAELGAVPVCVVRVDGAVESLTSHLSGIHPDLTIIEVDSLSVARKRYEAGQCAAVGGLRSDLAGIRARMSNADAHHLLDLELGKAPAGPRVREGDEQWAKVVQWVLFALIEAEELGIASTNVEALRRSPPSGRVGDLLGASGELGAGLGLGNDWAYQAVRWVGNYAEIYARNIGPGTPLELPRTRSRLWNRGGMLFAPPVR